MTDEKKKGKKKPTKTADDSGLFEMPSISTLMGRKKSKLSNVSDATRTAIDKGAFIPAPSQLELDEEHTGEQDGASQEIPSRDNPHSIAPIAIEDTPNTSQPEEADQGTQETTEPDTMQQAAKQAHEAPQEPQNESDALTPATANSIGKVAFDEEIHSSTDSSQPKPPLLKSTENIEKNAPNEVRLESEEQAPETPSPVALEDYEHPTYSSEGMTTPVIKKATRSNSENTKQTEPELIEWKLETLKKSKDPLAQGLIELLGGGAKQALFLIQTKNPESKMVPLFVYSAAFRALEKANLWKGLRWDPRLVPDLWSHIIQKGYFELDPPGPSTVATSARNVTRGGFGMHNTEWLTVIAVGPKDACRGLIAVVSDQNLQAVLPQALAKIQAKPKIKKKSAA